MLFFVDKVRFIIQKIKNSKANKEFTRLHPTVILPPDYLMYESFQLNYKKFYTDSHETAKWLCNHFAKHIELHNIKVLDWGCGPGRVIRHLPDVTDGTCEFYGTDYNSQSIRWCSENLKGIHFNKNNINASLPYQNNFFDVIYGISIFTHLSEQLHYDWYNELYRVLKPGGIMFLTTQGDNAVEKLTKTELITFNKGEIVVRGKVKEGHRTYSAFHPKPFMLKLFRNATILEHIALPRGNTKVIPQDIWILRK